jgi:aspartate racemase
MEQDFYLGRLREQHGIEVLVPDLIDRADVHHIIYDELCLGVISAESRVRYREVMAGLVQRGAQAIILGCTEISLLVDASDASVPLFDTTRLHAQHAADRALDA